MNRGINENDEKKKKHGAFALRKNTLFERVLIRKKYCTLHRSEVRVKSDDDQRFLFLI